MDTKRQLRVGNKEYTYYSLDAAKQSGLSNISALPFSLKILLENLLRYEDGCTVTQADIKAMGDWLKHKTSTHEIAYRPTRVLMQDFTGVPAIVDLAAMRAAIQALGGDPTQINPISPVDLIIDHSVQVDQFATNDAYQVNTQKEMERNKERYEFLRWGQQAFENFRVVPPGTGICHQVNLEHLGKTIWSDNKNGEHYAYPDTLVGTDSHTTMINGLGILGWGVGGIEAEAAMLGQPISMVIPEVIGFCLKGQLREGVTATDLVLTVTQMLRQKGVVGKFVEFYGSGLKYLSLPDRATIANMSPEFGATCGFFPIDHATIDYLKLTGRHEETVTLVEAYSKIQGLWYDESQPDPLFTDTLALDLTTVETSLAGPKHPQDRVNLSQLSEATLRLLSENKKSHEIDQPFKTDKGVSLHHGDVVIAAITSCTNTSNPSVLMAAGLLAKNAIEKGLQVKPWVKTSLAPGSKVVTEYLEKAGLLTYLNQLGFNLVGYGCTTCIGNSGPLPEDIQNTLTKNDLVVSSVLSGNRNFEGRVHPATKGNWLASPPLVVAFALKGTTRTDLNKEPLGKNKQGKDIYLRDIWPSNHDIAREVIKVTHTMFREQYANVFTGDDAWQNLSSSDAQTYQWQPDSTYVKHPPFFDGMQHAPSALTDIKEASILALLGDSITTDHISPAGSIKASSPAGLYLQGKGISPADFNSYGSRRGNHEVMMRGTFANIRIRNEMVPGTEGGFTKYIPTDETLSIYDAAMRYQEDKKSLVIVAGKEYGTGSSRDWAAKGPCLLGVRAVIAESFERIHRSNLIGMGILPLRFKENVTRKTLNLCGNEKIDIIGLSKGITPNMDVKAMIHRADGRQETISLLVRIETENEAAYYQHGGILHYVLRRMLKGS